MTITDTDQAAPVGHVEHIDPQAVEFEDNIRTAPRLDAGFLASIRAEGVLLPVLARRGEDGTIYVRDGQRRTLAAREVGLPTIPAYIGAGREDRISRITQQLVTNDRRDDLAGSERVAAFQTLALDGLSVAKIAKTTGTDAAQVKGSLAVAKSTTAREALDTGITLDRAILIAEFDGDQRALEEIEYAHDDDLDHVAGRIRHDRDVAEHRAKIIDRLTAEGITVVTASQSARLYSLTDAADDTDERPPLDDDTHAACEGRAVTLQVWGTGEDDYRTENVCTRPDLHHSRFGGRTTITTPAGEQTPEQIEAEQEARRTARRELIANNKAWDAAEQVRRDWITALLTRKTTTPRTPPRSSRSPSLDTPTT